MFVCSFITEGFYHQLFFKRPLVILMGSFNCISQFIQADNCFISYELQTDELSKFIQLSLTQDTAFLTSVSKEKR